MEDEKRYRVMYRRGAWEEDAYPGSVWDQETAEKLCARLNALPDQPADYPYYVIPTPAS